jgi:dolichol-phosphate mannosyltransferase
VQRYGKLSIVIPVYNEAATLGRLLEKVAAVKVPLDKEIIIVDDGSTDRSGEIARTFAACHAGTTVVAKTNGGKGSAVRLGLKCATGDILLIQDADLEYDPGDYPALLAPILSGTSTAVFGTRRHAPRGRLRERNPVLFMLHLIGNDALSLLTSVLYGRRITDMETCYKLFTRDIYRTLGLEADGFDIEPEIAAKILRAAIPIVEVPIRYYSRDFSEGKKITWVDGVKAAIALVKWRLLP